VFFFFAFTHRPWLRFFPLAHLTVFFFVVFFGGGVAAALPAPTNVAVAGAANIPGCGDGATLHESVVVQAGETASDDGHASVCVHTRASYMSAVPSLSFWTRPSSVVKNTSFPLALASKKSESVLPVPAEIKPTQPASASLKTTLAPWP
jgi:hypothetical protein